MNSHHSSRKRTRDDDRDEAVPISKRINRLQIESHDVTDNNNSLEPTPVPNGYNLPVSLTNQRSCVPSRRNGPITIAENRNTYQQMCLPITSIYSQPNRCQTSLSSNPQTSSIPLLAITNSICADSLITEHSVSTQNMHMGMTEERYSPELNSHENPFYYDINRVLYEANSSRLTRNSSSSFNTSSI